VATPNPPTPPAPPADPQPQPPLQEPFLTMRTTIILLAAFVIGVFVGTLTFFTGHIAAAAVLAGLIAFGGSIPALHSLIA